MKPIHHTFGPHVDRAYLTRVLLLSYLPWRYIKGPAPRELKSALKKHLKGEVSLFSSGRESLLALLSAMKLQSGEEVIVQGYTCVVVPNAVHAAGGSVIYADIDPDTLNLTPETVEPLITPRTRAIICQHTFGIPAEAKKLREICDRHGIVLIEDMAHIIPDAKGPMEIGAYGHALILSFGRDKAISGIAGGAVVCREPTLASRILEKERTAEHLGFFHVMRLLEYATRMHSVIRPLSGTPFFRIAIAIMNRLGTLVPIVTSEEKKGNMSPVLHKIPNVCAKLALYSLQKLPSLNARRRTLASFFYHRSRTNHWPMPSGIRPDLPLQKFPLFVAQAENFRKMLSKKNIHLDDGWTGCVICPDSVEPFDAGYEWGTDPMAEAASKQILNLPTHPTMTVIDAERVARQIDTLLKQTGLGYTPKQ